MPNRDASLPQGIPLPDGPWLYSHRFLEALNAAASMMLRSGARGGVPYISHRLPYSSAMAQVPST